MSQARPGVRKSIGKLAPTLQGIALDLKLGEEVAITTEEHYSVGHGQHFDIYAMKRVSESEVYLFKWHSDEETGNPTMDKHRRDLETRATFHPLTKQDKGDFPLSSDDYKNLPTGGC